MIKAIPLTCTGHSRPVTHLSFSGMLKSPLGDNSTTYLLISACKDGNPMLRDGVTGDWLGTFLGHKGAIWCSRLTEDGRYAITASADFSVILWDTITGDILGTFPHNHIVRSCDFQKRVLSDNYNDDADDDDTKHKLLIVTAGQDRTVRIWDTASERVIQEWGLDNAIRTVLWPSPGIIISVTSREIIWWEVPDKSLDSTAQPATAAAPEKISQITVDNDIIGQVEHDGDWIIVPAGNSLLFYHYSTGELVKKLDFDYPVSAASVSKEIDGEPRRLLTGCTSDTWVRYHDFETGKLLDTSKGHHGPVHAVWFSPDGSLAASGSEDGTIRLWKTTKGNYGLWNDT